MVTQEFKAQFSGAGSFWCGTCKVENDILFVKKPFWIFFSKWQIALGNASSVMHEYEERIYLDLEKGRTETVVRLYNFDLDTLQPYTPKQNLQWFRELESARQERSHLKSLYQQALRFMREHGIEDTFTSRIKDINNLANSMKNHIVKVGDEREGMKR